MKNSYLLYHNPIDFLFQYLHLFLQRQNVGVEDRFPQRPHFLYFTALFQLPFPAFQYLFQMFPYQGIQSFLMDTVGAANTFSVAMISLTDIFYPLSAIPVPAQRYKGTAALFAAQQSGIAVPGLVAPLRPLQ